MSLTHLPTGHPEVEHDYRAPFTSSDGMAHATHHRIGSAGIDAWTHTSVATGLPIRRVIVKSYPMHHPATVGANYLPADGWQDSNDISPAWIVTRSTITEPGRPATEIVTHLSIDQARTLHDHLTLALAEHDITQGEQR